jgi:hypothetical protein
MVRVVDYNANNINKKIKLRERFPVAYKKRPFVVAYPIGSLAYKKKHRKIFHAHDSLDDMLEYYSKEIGDNSTHVNQYTFSTVT